jgi:hypothetical protein
LIFVHTCKFLLNFRQRKKGVDKGSNSKVECFIDMRVEDVYVNEKADGEFAKLNKLSCVSRCTGQDVNWGGVC